jgi:putative tricarboxylic transport membrane protein
MSMVPSGPTRRPDGAAFIIAVLLAGLGLLLIREGYSVPDKSGYAGVGSGGLPKFIGWGLIALAAGHVVTGLRGGLGARQEQHVVPVLWIVAGLMLQLLLLRPLGFSIASGLLFACTAAGFGKTKLYFTLPIGIGAAFVIYGVFDQILRLKLPGGVLENLIYGG